MPLEGSAMAGIAMLQNARAKLKLEDEKCDKKEPAVPQPSPNKKHASEMEKKVKNMPGDTAVVKASSW